MKSIESLIPHRDPFLHIDRLVELNDQHCLAIKSINPDDPIFRGHFPGMPVYPGVLLVEAMGQAAGCHMANEKGERTQFFLAKGEAARFLHPVDPHVGDLYVKATFQKSKSVFTVYDCMVYNEKQVFAKTCIWLAVMSNSAT